MEVQIKRKWASSLLALSMLMAIPHSAAAMDETTEDIVCKAVKAGVEAGIKAAHAQEESTFPITISRNWLFASLLIIIPMWQCYRKTPRAEIPAEEEYSWQEIRESLEVLWYHYVTRPAKWFFRGEAKYTDEEVKVAAQKLWHNIKNLYNMGVVGQKKYYSLLQVYKGYIRCTSKTPARGICGHLFNMMGDGEKVLAKFLYLVGGYYFLKHITINGYKAVPKFIGEWTAPKTNIA